MPVIHQKPSESNVLIADTIADPNADTLRGLNAPTLLSSSPKRSTAEKIASLSATVIDTITNKAPSIQDSSKLTFRLRGPFAMAGEPYHDIMMMRVTQNIENAFPGAKPGDLKAVIRFQDVNPSLTVMQVELTRVPTRPRQELSAETIVRTALVKYRESGTPSLSLTIRPENVGADIRNDLQSLVAEINRIGDAQERTRLTVRPADLDEIERALRSGTPARLRLDVIHHTAAPQIIERAVALHRQTGAPAIRLEISAQNLGHDPGRGLQELIQDLTTEGARNETLLVKVPAAERVRAAEQLHREGKAVLHLQVRHLAAPGKEVARTLEPILERSRRSPLPSSKVHVRLPEQPNAAADAALATELRPLQAKYPAQLVVHGWNKPRTGWVDHREVFVLGGNRREDFEPLINATRQLAAPVSELPPSLPSTPARELAQELQGAILSRRIDSTRAIPVWLPANNHSDETIKMLAGLVRTGKATVIMSESVKHDTRYETLLTPATRLERVVSWFRNLAGR